MIWEYFGLNLGLAVKDMDLKLIKKGSTYNFDKYLGISSSGIDLRDQFLPI